MLFYFCAIQSAFRLFCIQRSVSYVQYTICNWCRQEPQWCDWVLFRDTKRLKHKRNNKDLENDWTLTTMLILDLFSTHRKDGVWTGFIQYKFNSILKKVPFHIFNVLFSSLINNFLNFERLTPIVGRKVSKIYAKASQWTMDPNS